MAETIINQECVMSASNPTDETTTAVPPVERVLDPSLLTGYASTISLFASRYKQGGRTIYSLDLTPEQIMATIARPDPTMPNPGNRQIRPKHAEDFGKYVRARADWVSPSVMLRTPSPFDFDTQIEVAGIQFGILTIPRRSIGDLHIVDGQHRALGLFRASETLDVDLDKAQTALANARRNDGAGSAGERAAQKTINELKAQRARLNDERLNVQIIVESDEKAYRQIFYDVADNALGITASVRARFDSRKVVNRALPLVMDVHPLLKGRVDPEGDRLGRGSPYMMGAKHVAEVIRTTNVGIDGRVSNRQEDEFDEKAVAKNALDFFDAAVAAFPQLYALEHAQITPDDLRRGSLLGSVLFVRVLAGAMYDLLRRHAFDQEMVTEFFKKLAPHTAGPAYVGSIWVDHLPEFWNDGAFAPASRRQDIIAFKNALVDWAITKPKFVEAKPKPRPEPEEDVLDVSTEEEMRAADEVIARRHRER